MKRVISGMRPTGRLHLGNLEGALKNWIKLQDSYESFFMVADLHALTTEYASPKSISSDTREMVIDWVSMGLDPGKSILFVQSNVPAHAELHLVLSMITPISWLERCPTYKEQINTLVGKDLSTYGFLGYPVLQSADILIYKGEVVPVGEDQLPHLELTREITRRFNRYYGNVFPEPDALLTRTPRVLGTDGRKMSKSYNNCIYLSDTEEEVNKKVMGMFTCPDKIRLSDPGKPEECPVHSLHKPK
jgi:tryptophanyl-tRNA synthetase